jgi:hypothetical protein
MRLPQSLTELAERADLRSSDVSDVRFAMLSGSAPTKLHCLRPKDFTTQASSEHEHTTPYQRLVIGRQGFTDEEGGGAGEVKFHAVLCGGRVQRDPFRDSNKSRRAANSAGDMLAAGTVDACRHTQQQQPQQQHHHHHLSCLELDFIRFQQRLVSACELTCS